MLRLLDRVLDYYRRHEPSSPVPLLVAGAEQLLARLLKDPALREALAQAPRAGAASGDGGQG